MKLYYQTASATLVQFIAMSLLSAVNNIISVVQVCTGDKGGCFSNSTASVAFFLVTALWFGFIWVLGFAAQEKRSRLLAYALIGAEFLVLGIAYINFKHGGNALTTITSGLDIVLSIWIMVLAFRLSRSKGGRIVKSERARRRSIQRHLKE